MSSNHDYSDDHDDDVPPSKSPIATRPIASVFVESLCKLLADARVRTLLRAFERSGSSSLNESTAIDNLVSESSRAREDVRLQMHHILLPKLTDSDILEYEAETSRIHYRPHSRLTTLLEHAHEDPWSVQNRCFDALGHPQRRIVLSEIIDADEARALTSLTFALLTDVGRLPSKQVSQKLRRAQTVLVHNHLPRLVASNLVTYREEAEKVVLRATPAAHRLPAYLSTLDAVETR